MKARNRWKIAIAAAIITITGIGAFLVWDSEELRSRRDRIGQLRSVNLIGKNWSLAKQQLLAAGFTVREHTGERGTEGQSYHVVPIYEDLSKALLKAISA